MRSGQDIVLVQRPGSSRTTFEKILRAEGPAPMAVHDDLHQLRRAAGGINGAIVLLHGGLLHGPVTACVRELTTVHRGPLVICWKGGSDGLHDALVAGAQGIHHEGDPPHELVAGLRRLRQGFAFLGPTAQHALIFHLRRTPTPAPGVLTAREAQVMRAVADGHTYARIGALCSISPNTVKNHVHNAIKKLGARNRVEAVNRFCRTK